MIATSQLSASLRMSPPVMRSARPRRAARKQMLRALASGIYNACAMIVTELPDEEATAALAARIAALARPGDVIALERRTRGRQNNVRARLHPGPRRCRGGAEPNLHAGPGLRGRRRPDLAFRRLPAARPRRGLGTRHRGRVPRRHFADRMAGAARDAAAGPAASDNAVRLRPRRTPAAPRSTPAATGPNGSPASRWSAEKWAWRRMRRHGRGCGRAALDGFLAAAGWAGVAPVMLAGDASFRRYYRLTAAGRRAVLMDAPPPMEDVGPYIAVAEMLRDLGLSAPEIYAEDRAARVSADRGFRRRRLYAPAGARRRRSRALCARDRHAGGAAPRRRRAGPAGAAALRRGASARRGRAAGGLVRAERARRGAAGRGARRISRALAADPAARRTARSRRWCCATIMSTI